jgi:phage terminase large subunit-like protein
MGSREDLIEAVQLTEELLRRKVQRKILVYYPDTGPLRRELYVKHMEFFKAGATHRERLMLAANRIGKTEGVGGYETVLHLTGDYPKWWPGRRFKAPIKAWAAGDTRTTVRDIIQEKLLGPVGHWGTGLIPGESIERISRVSGTADAVDTIFVKHKPTGKTSRVVLKSYDQRRESFQGTEQDLIWLDEEPPIAIYTECLMRTMTNDGIVLLTFTPLMGISEVVLSFLPGGDLKTVGSRNGRYIVMATWDDAPHLDDKTKAELLSKIPAFQRDARSKGVPQLGAGAIYPVPESEIVVDPFEIPDHWPRGYGMDVGWNCTAAIFGAHNRETDTVYLFHEYAKGEAEPSTHVHGIQAPGLWLPGFIDPAARGRAQRDGKRLLQDYIDLGLNLDVADNAVEAGLYRVWQRLASGKMKVFRTMSGWLGEYRLYRRDVKGEIVKANDHRMDATRYLDSRIDGMCCKPVKKATTRGDHQGSSTSWMG